MEPGNISEKLAEIQIRNFFFFFLENNHIFVISEVQIWDTESRIGV